MGEYLPMEDFPNPPFSPYNRWIRPELVDPDLENEPDLGSCDAFAFQVSEFFPGAIYMSGTTEGRWFITPGRWSTVSSARFEFRTDSCIVYDLSATVLPGDWPSVGLVGGAVEVQGPIPSLLYHYLEGGQIVEHARMGPGEYKIYGWSSGSGDMEEWQGATFEALWTCTPCAPSFMARQPADVTVACGGTAVFSAGSSMPAGSVTYQWRRNLVPLTDGGQISGATSPTLTISNACTADAAYYYDVVVTYAGQAEPSRLVRIHIATATGVEDSPQAFSITGAAPNPFTEATTFHYSVRSPTRIVMVIYDVKGAVVRTLEDRVITGTGSITWDGRTRSGAKAAPGIYFLRVEAGTVRETRKLVLLQ
ncbi:MAG TPA: FlgD immunoglobulin-like domain containing protein [Candidatus Eisenbacteria bacterium]|nr:FlgD immunoglobulin-like domain containing protein [Candidatus Eisenbacteria bacterium]